MSIFLGIFRSPFMSVFTSNLGALRSTFGKSSLAVSIPPFIFKFRVFKSGFMFKFNPFGNLKSSDSAQSLVHLTLDQKTPLQECSNVAFYILQMGCQNSAFSISKPVGTFGCIDVNVWAICALCPHPISHFRIV